MIVTASRSHEALAVALADPVHRLRLAPAALHLLPLWAGHDVSSGTPIPYADAMAIAMELRDRLDPSCERIAIAGSLRRERPEVGDIELVAVPRVESRTGEDLWGTPTQVDLLEEAITTLISAGALRARPVESHRADGSIDVGQRMGGAYKALEFRGMPVDLFVVRPPAQWGVIFAIRTGPGDWNQRLVTDCQRFLRRVAGGQVYRSGAPVPCPEEEDFFRAVGQPWVEPAERSIARVDVRATA